MREAEPGEFTRLSVANNKMSLNEAEMVSTLLTPLMSMRLCKCCCNFWGFV